MIYSAKFCPLLTPVCLRCRPIIRSDVLVGRADQCCVGLQPCHVSAKRFLVRICQLCAVSCPRLLFSLCRAIGFAVDYGVHIAEAFAVSNLEDNNSRTIHALSDLGSSVLHGGASTFLAILFLAFSESGGFRILFKMFFGLVGFGLLHGLILLPVLLSIAGPPPASAGRLHTP